MKIYIVHVFVGCCANNSDGKILLLDILPNGHIKKIIMKWFFGYGVDNDKDVWNTIKNNNCGYAFSDKEIKVINNWFKGD